MSEMASSADPRNTLFVTPARRRKAADVHEIREPYELRALSPECWQKKRLIPSVEAEELRPAAESEDVRPRAQSPDGPDAWVAFAAWNSGSMHIDSLRTTWVVPRR